MTDANLICEIKKRSPDISDTDCYCDACRQLCYKRSKGKEVSTPMAKKKVRPPVAHADTNVCLVQEYNNPLNLSPCDGKMHALEQTVFTSGQVASCFGVVDSNFTTVDKHVCHRHYCVMYKDVSCPTIAMCAACNIHIKQGDRLRRCSALKDFEVASVVLSQVKHNLTITKDTILCNTCYMLAYNDRNLVTLDSIEKEIVNDDYDEGNVDKPCDALKYVYLFVIKSFKSNEGFLLKEIYDLYTDKIKGDAQSQIKTPQWLLSALLSRFGKLIVTDVISSDTGNAIPKCGTLISYKKMDYKKAYHLMLSKMRFAKQRESHESYKPFHDHSNENARISSTDIDTMAYHVSTYLNQKLYDQAKQMNEFYLSDLDRVCNFRYDKVMQACDPIVWNFFSNLTCNSTEKKFVDNLDFDWKKDHLVFPNSDTKHGRQRLQQRVNSILNLQFILNNNFNYPLHIIIANCIKRLSGGSSKLLGMMNNCGVCTSEDTLERFLELVSRDKKMKGFEEFLSNRAFAIASCDNIDILLANAMVAYLKDRSWHGTSIMAQQPKPLAEKWSSMGESLEGQHEIENESSTHDKVPNIDIGDDESTDDCLESSEPPVKKAKVCKPRVRRSLAPTYNYLTDDKFLFDKPAYKTFIPDQLPSNFNHTVEELSEAGRLSEDVFLYVLERYIATLDDTNTLLPGMKCKFAMENGTERERSSFFYMSILDEKADCLMTMKHVLEIIHKRFEISKSLNHLIVVGDAKTFEYIMKLKDQYGKELEWLIPYPGDWHVLKNFQEVLIKIFWDAGLKDIAKVVHRGGLGKVQSCSIFKRTHRLLIQVYEALYLHQLQSFLKQRDGSLTYSNEDILAKITETVNSLSSDDDTHGDGDCFPNIDVFVEKQNALKSKLIPDLHQEFKNYSCEMSTKFKTFKFWNSFLKRDCFAYIQLWSVIRSGNWNLRLSASTNMTSIE